MRALTAEVQELRKAWAKVERHLQRSRAGYEWNLGQGGFGPPFLADNLARDVELLRRLERAMAEAKSVVLIGAPRKRGEHGSVTLPRDSDLAEIVQLLAKAFAEAGKSKVSGTTLHDVLGRVFSVSSDAIRKRLVKATRPPKRGRK